MVLRVKGEGCVGESASSTSKDRFNAGKKKMEKKNGIGVVNDIYNIPYKKATTFQ